MSNLHTKNKVPLAKKAYLCELISTLKEKRSLDELKKLHSEGYDTFDLLACCMEGVRRVGLKFEQGDYYISALIMAGEIMRQASEFLSSFIAVDESVEVTGTVLLGTIEGDIHDLGKNILKDLLTCNGFKVVDLGVDVSPETFVEKAEQIHPDFVCISCLLTNCLESLAKAVRLIRMKTAGMNNLVLIGGACMDQTINEFIKADQWFVDAVKAVAFCRKAVEAKGS